MQLSECVMFCSFWLIWQSLCNHELSVVVCFCLFKEKQHCNIQNKTCINSWLWYPNTHWKGKHILFHKRLTRTKETKSIHNVVKCQESHTCVRYICGTHYSSNLFHRLKIGRQPWKSLNWHECGRSLLFAAHFVKIMIDTDNHIVCCQLSSYVNDFSHHIFYESVNLRDVIEVLSSFNE